MPLLVLLLVAALTRPPAPPGDFAGRWVLDPSGTSALDPWREITLDVTAGDDRVVLVRRLTWGRRSATDSLNVPVDGRPVAVPFPAWLDNRHLAVWAAGEGTKRVAAQWLDEGRTLQLVSTMTVATSQGEQPMRVLSEYRLSPSGDRLTLIELRSSRNRPVIYTFVRPS